MSLNHLLLGLLSIRPQTGYDLNKTFQQSVQNFWTTDQSQIYRALHRMVEKGLVDVDVVTQEDYPDKKVYQPTQAGIEELQRWLTTPITGKNAPVREGWLGQIFFGTQVPVDDLVAVLNTYIAERQVLIQHLKSIESAIGDNQPDSLFKVHVLMTLDYGIHITQAMVEWLERTAQRMIELNDDAGLSE